MSTFTLYRFYAADDALLYVGLTINPGRRLEKHRALQPWWNDVARVELEQHPDMPTLRAAEREAIKTETPLYNIRMNARYAETFLEWSCDICETPIGDDDGYITVSDHEIRRYKTEVSTWNAAHPKNQDGLTIRPLSDWNDYPERVRWRVLHRGCDPNPKSVDYWIGVERIRTYPRVLEWTAHLMEKTWLPDTTWRHILRRAAA